MDDIGNASFAESNAPCHLCNTGNSTRVPHQIQKVNFRASSTSDTETYLYASSILDTETFSTESLLYSKVFLMLREHLDQNSRPGACLLLSSLRALMYAPAVRLYSPTG